MYCLIQDNDCHWYVIPKDKISEFYLWVEHCEEDCYVLLDKFDNGDESYEEPQPWLGFNFESCRVDGPHSVFFDKFTTEND